MAPPRAARDAETTLARLRAQHPDAHCELNHADPFQLLVSTVLSAQTTDVNVNKATPGLFARWGTPEALAKADPADVEKAIGSLGFFRQKTKSILALSKDLVEKYGGKVPASLDALVQLRGVGRKTANVVLGVSFGAPEGVVVDTHVQRISQRLGWTKNTEPEKIEQDLVKLFPRKDWDPVSHTLIFHGRRVCSAAKPACAACSVNDVCPSAFQAEKVGRKPLRARGPTPTPHRQASPMARAKKTKKAKKKTKLPAARHLGGFLAPPASFRELANEPPAARRRKR